MGRPICQAYLLRNEEIRKEYVDNNATLDALHDRYGLTKTRLRTILERQGVELRPERRSSRLHRRPKNSICIAIGARLHGDRMKRNCTVAEYALHIGLSEAHLSDAFQGLYDWRLTELVRVAAALDISLEGLTRTSAL